MRNADFFEKLVLKKSYINKKILTLWIESALQMFCKRVSILTK